MRSYIHMNKHQRVAYFYERARQRCRLSRAHLSHYLFSTQKACESECEERRAADKKLFPNTHSLVKSIKYRIWYTTWNPPSSQQLHYCYCPGALLWCVEVIGLRPLSDAASGPSMIVNNSFGLCNFLLRTAHTFHRCVSNTLVRPALHPWSGCAGDTTYIYIHSAARSNIWQDPKVCNLPWKICTSGGCAAHV